MLRKLTLLTSFILLVFISNAQDPKALLEQAEVLLSKGQYEQAETKVDQAENALRALLKEKYTETAKITNLRKRIRAQRSQASVIQAKRDAAAESQRLYTEHYDNAIRAYEN